jgi:hypothetical protein
MDTSRAHNKKLGLARLIAGNLAIFGLLLIIIEGLASYGLLVRSIMTTSIMAERRHTKYDPDLGWVNEPNVNIRDMYGPGIYLRTNAQGFRNNHNISAAVPAGKARIVCSGDSFTLGYGVDNEHTWCSLLSFLEPRLEAVNMGQGGYGVDQAYLWHKRDGAKIEHQVHLFAFITGDFSRMKYDSFEGYPKPVLDVENGTLVVKNVPVPRRNYYFPWIENLGHLRTVEFLNRVRQKIGLATTDSHQAPQTRSDEHTRELLHKMFADLKSLNERRSSKLVLVYLPDIDALKSEGPREWTNFLEEESRSLEIPLINLFPEFRSLPHQEVVDLFISEEKRGIGHFNEAGNALVAKLIHDKLMNHPAISRVLSARLR